MPLSRAFQWAGVAAVLLVLVGLNYEFESKAGMQMNAAPESPLSQSLRGYWKLDDGSGTNATDASGNGNTLAMTGSPSWVAGQIGPSSLDFSGTGQYLSVADPSSGVLDIGDSTDFSITGWFNRDTFANDHTIVAKRNSSATNTDTGYIVWIDAAADKLNFTVGDGGGTAGDQYTLASTSTFTATGWHQFTAVWDDSLGMQLYIDGKLDNSTTSSTSSIGSLANAVAFRIGAESDAGNPFDGKIDDVRVYGYALSTDQVKKLYQTTSPTQPIDTSLVGHWTFDGPDIQGTTAIDRSSYGNNGTITGTTKTIGKLGQGLSLSYNSTDVINAGSASSLDDLTQKTLCAWMYPRSYGVSANDATIFNKDSSGGWSLILADDNGPTNALYFFQTTWSSVLGKWRTQANSITLNTWQHICVTYDRSSASNDPVMYINGTPVSITEYSTPSGSYNSEAANSLYIGNWDTSSTGSFDGILDDVRIYNRILSQTEITNLYNIGG